jgi:hypothetical protein
MCCRPIHPCPWQGLVEELRLRAEAMGGAQLIGRELFLLMFGECVPRAPCQLEHLLPGKPC